MPVASRHPSLYQTFNLNTPLKLSWRSTTAFSEIQVAPKPAQIDKMALRAPQLAHFVRAPSHNSFSQLGGVSIWVRTVGRWVGGWVGRWVGG